MALPVGEIGEISHPEFVNADYKADNLTFKLIYKATIYQKIAFRVKNIIKKL